MNNPVQLTVTAPMAITANFDPGTIVTTSPVGRAFIVDGSTYGSLQTFYWPESSIHTIEAPSPQTVAGTRFVFSSWSDGGAQTHSVAAASSSPVTYTASYSTQYELQISVNPPGSATVTSSYPLVDSFVNSGSSVGLLALPAADYVFGSWSGDCSSSFPYVSFSMTAPRTCTANLSACANDPVQVLGGASYDSFQLAYNIEATAEGDTIQVLAVNLAESVDLGRDIGVILNGGFDCDYMINDSATLLTGSLTVSRGSVTIEGMIIR
jgi:hypothetical protein